MESSRTDLPSSPAERTSNNLTHLLTALEKLDAHPGQASDRSSSLCMYHYSTVDSASLLCLSNLDFVSIIDTMSRQSLGATLPVRWRSRRLHFSIVFLK